MKILRNKKTLYDGNAKGLAIDGIECSYDNIRFVFRYRNIVNFINIDRILNSGSIETLKAVIGASKNIPYENYINIEELSLGFIAEDDFIFIVAYGEVQFSHYRVTLEAIVSDYDVIQ